jgi:hypothetical protein
MGQMNTRQLQPFATADEYRHLRALEAHNPVQAVPLYERLMKKYGEQICDVEKRESTAPAAPSKKISPASPPEAPNLCRAPGPLVAHGEGLLVGDPGPAPEEAVASPLSRNKSVDAPRATKPLLVTRLTNYKGLLAKRFRLGIDGAPVKSTAAFLERGRADTLQIDGLTEFVQALASLEHNQAFAFGVTGRESVELVTKDQVHEHPGAIARSREFFAYHNGPAILMLDCDADHVTESYDAEALRGAVVRAVPELEQAAMLWTASSSSCIVRADTGTEVIPLRGQRLYILVADGTDIPRALTALYERLWLAGFGRYIVSKSGRLLDRNLIDESVGQPERIDFAAGAKCDPPLEQRRPEPRLWGDPRTQFDSRVIKDLTVEEQEQVASLRHAARRSCAEEAQRTRSTYLEKTTKEVAESRGITHERAHFIVREAVERQLLFADFVLIPSEGEPVTVAQIIDDPARWHGKRFADPVEPDYRGDRRIAYVNLRSGGRPYLFSHAHGGQRYELCRQPTHIKLQPGEEARIADDVLEVLRHRGDVFDFGADMARVTEGGLIVGINRDWLKDYISRHIRFERFDKRTKEWAPTGTPDVVVNAILARSYERGLPTLTAVVTAPTMRPDSSLLDTPGLDNQTGLLFISEDPQPVRVPVEPSIEQVLAARDELWQPFAGFPFVDNTARGVMLAALLTVVIRRGLPTAPGTAFDAPSAGTGKTLLAKAVAALGGHEPRLMTPPTDDDEARKVLFAAVREGAGVVIWDNLVRALQGAPLNAFLTAEVFADRILGVSETAAPPNRALFIATGNNVRLVGDTCRRVLLCRIDARVEVPYLRRFEFDPLAWVRDRRQRLVRAALTILRGYQVRGTPVALGRMASFEVWDNLVRQCVAWLGEVDTGIGFVDPASSALHNTAEDPAKATLAAVLRAWRTAFGDQAVGVGEAWKRASGDLGVEPDGTLRDAIEAIAEGESGFNTRRLGGWLRQHAEEIAAGMRFVGETDSSRNMNLWRVEVMS